jgi:hypothetical protein
MTKPDISPRQQRFIAAMLTARTVADAARQAGVAERTAYRYLDDPEIRAALDLALDQSISYAARHAAAGMNQALVVLQAILEDVAAPPAAPSSWPVPAFTKPSPSCSASQPLKVS